MEAMRLYLRSRGIVVGDKVIDTGFGFKALFCKDFNGHEVEFLEYTGDGFIGEMKDGTRVELMTEKAVSGTPSPSTYGLPLHYDGDMTPLLYKYQGYFLFLRYENNNHTIHCIADAFSVRMRQDCSKGLSL